MQSDSRELKLAFLAIVLITLIYILVLGLLGEIPPANELFGHAIGIVGFILMVITETLYTMRKRSHNARWGRMASWLQFHIFTGIVGPYMVLLHSSWKFNGVAGIVTLLTIFTVGSGFLGRYIYTAVPRTADGVELEANEIERQISIAEADLQRWIASQHPTPQFEKVLIAENTQPVIPHGAAGLEELPYNIPTQVGLNSSGSQAAESGTAAAVLGRGLKDWRQRWRWWRDRQALDPAVRRQADTLEQMVRKRDTLRRQLSSLAMVRRMLGIWHAVHIPIGLALFTLAIVHILAAIYYGLLLG